MGAQMFRYDPTGNLPHRETVAGAMDLVESYCDQSRARFHATARAMLAEGRTRPNRVELGMLEANVRERMEVIQRGFDKIAAMGNPNGPCTPEESRALSRLVELAGEANGTRSADGQELRSGHGSVKVTTGRVSGVERRGARGGRAAAPARRPAAAPAPRGPTPAERRAHLKAMELSLQDPEETRRVAYHEGGHAVVAVVDGLTLLEVRILTGEERRDSGLGGVCRALRPIGTQRWTVAGPLAEAIYTGVYVQGTPDAQEALAAIKKERTISGCHGSESAQEELHQMQVDVDALLRRERAALDAIAGELVKRGSLSGTEAERIIKSKLTRRY